jgi:DNA-binding MarR family transcriptional regulator
LAPITLARLIDKLTASGLVERRDHATDRRANRLYLTDKAGPTLDRLGELGDELMGRALDGLGPEALSELRQRLDRIKHNLKSELKSEPKQEFKPALNVELAAGV